MRGHFFVTSLLNGDGSILIEESLIREIGANRFRLTDRLFRVKLIRVLHFADVADRFPVQRP